MGHKAADVTNKGRGNINFFYCTTQNSDAFFDDIEDKYSIDNDDIRNYKDLQYGMIRYDLIKNTYIVIDKHKDITFHSEIPKVNLNILKHKKTFSKQGKDQYDRFLKSRLNEPDEYDPAMFHEFLNDYLITQKVTPQPNILDKFNNGTK